MEVLSSGGRCSVGSAVLSVLGRVRVLAGDEVSGAGVTAGKRLSNEAACSHLPARNIAEVLERAKGSGNEVGIDIWKAGSSVGYKWTNNIAQVRFFVSLTWDISSMRSSHVNRRLEEMTRQQGKTGRKKIQNDPIRHQEAKKSAHVSLSSSSTPCRRTCQSQRC